MSWAIWVLDRLQSDGTTQTTNIWPVKDSHAERVAQLIDTQRDIYAPNPFDEVRKQELVWIEWAQWLIRPEHLEGSKLYQSRFAVEKNRYQASLIATNDNYISERLSDHLWIDDLERLFHSPWAVTMLEDGVLHDTVYNNSGWYRNALGLGWSYDSNVSLVYWDDLLVWLSEQKAALWSIFAMMRGNYTFSTSVMQAVLWVYWKALNTTSGSEDYWDYTRGLFSKGWKAVWISGSQVYHESAEQVLQWVLWSEQWEDTLDMLSPIKPPLPEHEQFANSVGSESWRVDLLAGIFDELYARLLVTHISDWDAQIKYVAEDIIAHAEQGALWKLC